MLLISIHCALAQFNYREHGECKINVLPTDKPQTHCEREARSYKMRMNSDIAACKVWTVGVGGASIASPLWQTYQLRSYLAKHIPLHRISATCGLARSEVAGGRIWRPCLAADCWSSSWTGQHCRCTAWECPPNSCSLDCNWCSMTSPSAQPTVVPVWWRSLFYEVPIDRPGSTGLDCFGGRNVPPRRLRRIHTTIEHIKSLKHS